MYQLLTRDLANFMILVHCSHDKGNKISPFLWI